MCVYVCNAYVRARVCMRKRIMSCVLFNIVFCFICGIFFFYFYAQMIITRAKRMSERDRAKFDDDDDDDGNG